MNDNNSSTKETKIGLIKKIIIWILVLFITIMLIVIVIFQPRFYTFIN